MCAATARGSVAPRELQFVVDPFAWVQLIACLVALSFPWLIGCIGTQVPTKRLSESTSRKLRQSMKIYARAQLDEGSVDRLGVVSAISCKTSAGTGSTPDRLHQLN